MSLYPMSNFILVLRNIRVAGTKLHFYQSHERTIRMSTTYFFFQLRCFRIKRNQFKVETLHTICNSRGAPLPYFSSRIPPRNDRGYRMDKETFLCLKAADIRLPLTIGRFLKLAENSTISLGSISG